MSKCCSRIHGYHVYKQGWLTLVGEVLQCEWEARNREDPHMVVVVNDGLIGHVTRISLEFKLCGFIFVKLHSFAIFVKFTSCETYTVNEDITLNQRNE